ncbi:MAG: hypothetical protein AB8E82_13925 [Aureispira sp.]
MAFNISPKIKAGEIKSKSLDFALVGKYYKAVQATLAVKTSVEKPTAYFFHQNFLNGEPLILFGKPTAAHKKVFLEAGKSNEKDLVSIGTCFVLKENNQKVLCLQPNASLGKAKEKPSMKVLNKLKRASLKQFAEIRWLKAPLMIGEDGNVEQVTEGQDSGTGMGTGTDGAPISDQQNTSTGSTTQESTSTTTRSTGEPSPQTGPTGSTAVVSRAHITKRSDELQRGLDKLNNDVMPRFKKQDTMPTDRDFITALRKAILIFLNKLGQADDSTKSEFSSKKSYLDSLLPQLKELEQRLKDPQGTQEERAKLQEKLQVEVNKMNGIHDEIRSILQRIDLKTLA